MAFNPQTGLVYIPAQGIPVVVEDDKQWVYNSSASLGPQNGTGWNTGVLLSMDPPKTMPFGHLLAWDPVNQKPAWKVEHTAPWNGGVLTTAGNLVFQGTADGRFVAYNAKTGDKLWESPTGTGVIAAPITYEMDGKQYVSIAVGWGGSYGLSMRHSPNETPGKIYTFAIGGKEKMPEFAKVQSKPFLTGIDIKVSPQEIQLGGKLYINNCVICHGIPGVGGGRIPNLGYSDKGKIQNLDKYVLEGIAAELGMPNFKDRLNKGDVEKIQAFIQVMTDQVAKQMEMAKAKALK